MVGIIGKCMVFGPRKHRCLGWLSCIPYIPDPLQQPHPHIAVCNHGSRKVWPSLFHQQRCSDGKLLLIFFGVEVEFGLTLTPLSV